MDYIELIDFIRNINKNNFEVKNIHIYFDLKRYPDLRELLFTSNFNIFIPKEKPQEIDCSRFDLNNDTDIHIFEFFTDGFLVVSND